MTTRIKAVTVVLQEDFREDADELRNICALIEQIRGVVAVEKIEVDPSDFVAQERAKHELAEKLWGLLR